MSAKPTVGVVVPVYNCERYLGECLESILGQGYDALDVIVVDDGSTDGSAQVARSFAPRVRYVFHENRGIGITRNRGAELVQQELLAFCDADDVWMPQKLELQLAALAEDPDLEAVFGHARQFASPELGPEVARRIPQGAEVLPAQLSTAMLIRREAFERVGPFDSCVVGIDMSWYTRAVDAGLAMRTLDEVVYRRRIHETNQGLAANAALDRLQTLKAILDRRRRRQDLAS